MPIQIPVEFDHEGATYKGVLSSVSGAGSGLGGRYDLILNNMYFGQLWQAEDSPPGRPRDPSNVSYKWRFVSQTGKFQNLAEYFANVVIAWYQ